MSDFRLLFTKGYWRHLFSFRRAATAVFVALGSLWTAVECTVLLHDGQYVDARPLVAVFGSRGGFRRSAELATYVPVVPYGRTRHRGRGAHRRRVRLD